jgi:hypothetical protein
MNKAITFTNYIKLISHVIVMLLLVAVAGVLGVMAYNEGYTNGEQNGSLFMAQYTAQQCHKGGKLMLFGETYYCGRIQKL